MKNWWLLLLLSLTTKSYALSWSELWSTPDQQAQNQMKAGQFKQAEQTFQQKAWRAAAAYRAGDFAQAAKYYQSMQNEEGYYNAGNALTHMNHYQQAINSYDKALSLNPHNKDALYNRKLVQELLKKQTEQQNKNQQSKDQQDKSQQHKDQQSKDQQDKEPQGKDQENKDQQGKDQRDKDRQDKEQQSKEQQGKDGQNKEQQSKEQRDKDRQNSEQQSKEQQGKDRQDNEQQSKEQQGKARQDKEQQDKEQQDKEQPSKNQQDNNQHSKGPQSKQKTAVAVDELQSEKEREKQQVKDQWLRLIPDDPGGLTRRKFLRDHLRRHGGWYQ